MEILLDLNIVRAAVKHFGFFYNHLRIRTAFELGAMILLYALLMKHEQSNNKQKLYLIDLEDH